MYPFSWMIHFFPLLKILIGHFRISSYWIQIGVSFHNPVLDGWFQKSLFKIAIVREKIFIFFQFPVPWSFNILASFKIFGVFMDGLDWAWEYFDTFWGLTRLVPSKWLKLSYRVKLLIEFQKINVHIKYGENNRKKSSLI